MLRHIVKRKQEQPQTAPHVKLFGGEISARYFSDWQACGRKTFDVFGVGLLQLPAWLYWDLMFLSSELFWHEEEVKRPSGVGLPKLDDVFKLFTKKD